MKASEIIRIVIFGFLGFIIMFFVQPWIYENRIIPIKDVPVGEWLSDSYTTGAGVVFAVSILATVVWYVLAANAKVTTAAETDKWRVTWWILLLLPIISICLGISPVFNSSKDALVSLTGFYILDAIVILYWLPTGSSSPSLLMYIPPGARLLRGIFGG
jgi:hypothetical protein